MFIFQNLKLKNFVFYESQSLDLDYQGTTVIRGRNYNNMSNASEQLRSNGSGKSLLLSALATALYDTMPMISQKKAMKSSWDQGEICVDFTVQGQHWTVIRQQIAGSTQLQLFKDGVNINPRTQTIAKSILAELLPWTEDEFFSQVYLDSRRSHPLQVGSNNERMATIATLFHLTDFDLIKERLKADYADQKLSLRDQSHIQQQIDQITEQLQALSPTDDLHQQLHRVQKKKETIEQKLNQLYQLQSNATVWDNYQQLHDQWQQSLDVIGISKDSFLAQRETISTLQAQYNEHQTSLAHYNQWQNMIQTAQQQQQLCETQDPKLATLTNITEYLDQLTEQFHHRQQQLTVMHQLKDQLEQLKCSKPVPDLAPTETLDNLQQQLTTTFVQINQDQKQLDGLQACHESNCWVCQHPLSHEQQQALIIEIQTRLALLNQQAQQLQVAIEAKINWQETHQRYQQYKEKLTQFKQLRDQLAQEPNSEQMQQTIRNTQHYLNVQSQLAIPQPMVTPKPTQSVEQWVKCDQQYQLLIQSQPQTPRPKLAMSLIKKLIKNYFTLSNLYQERATTYAVQLDKRQHLEQQLASCNEKLIEINNALSNSDIMPWLLDAYSNKGLKLLAIQHLCTMLEERLNLYAPLLFSEVFVFTLQVTQTDFQILARRIIHGKEVLMDIKFLSGAEGRAFSLLLLISLISLLPNHRRSNLLVLDEMTANFDPVGMDLVINQFLPILNTMIPHLIVIAIDNKEYVNSRQFFATKQGDRTVLMTD
jgi:DNA repair exonuclease SbcCD ATPase subunit